MSIATPPVFHSTAEFTETPISRTEAAAAGRKFFFTGEPCHRGHVVRRYVSTGACTVCQRQHSLSASKQVKAYRMQRGVTMRWCIAQYPEALEAALFATLKAMGVTVKEPAVGPREASKMHATPAGWKPPAALTDPHLASTGIVELASGGRVYDQIGPSGQQETVEVGGGMTLRQPVEVPPPPPLVLPAHLLAKP